MLNKLKKILFNRKMAISIMALFLTVSMAQAITITGAVDEIKALFGMEQIGGNLTNPGVTQDASAPVSVVNNIIAYDFDVANDFAVDGDTSLNGTTTIARSYDGFVAQDDYTVASGTAKAIFTNNTGVSMMCDAESGFVDFNATGFSPAFYIAIGTSTTATGYSTNLIASTTVASSTDTVLPFTYALPFKLANTESIVGALSDVNANASSTHNSNWDVEFGVHCWQMGQ